MVGVTSACSGVGVGAAAWLAGVGVLDSTETDVGVTETSSAAMAVCVGSGVGVGVLVTCAGCGVEASGLTAGWRLGSMWSIQSASSSAKETLSVTLHGFVVGHAFSVCIEQPPDRLLAVLVNDEAYERVAFGVSEDCARIRGRES